jgi:hypothetical protein
MKTTTKVLTLVGMLTAASQGATTITGTIGSQFKGSDLTTNIASGSLVMLISDTGAAGFLTASGSAITASTTALSGTTLETAGLLTVGSSFGGDTIMAVGTAGSSGSISGFAGFNTTGLTSKNFALVWFTQAAGAVGGGSYFGMMSLADWSMPGDADGKSYTLSSTDAGGANGFFSTSTATTAAQLGGTGFITGSGVAGVTTNIVKGATFQIIPEPSAALLGALGALGLLRRRRN